MGKPKTITERDIQRFLKKNGPTTMTELAEHFGEAVHVVRVNQGFRDFIGQILRKNNGVGLDENWRLTAVKNNSGNANLHLLQKWSLNEIHREATKEAAHD